MPDGGMSGRPTGGLSDSMASSRKNRIRLGSRCALATLTIHGDH